VIIPSILECLAEITLVKTADGVECGAISEECEGNWMVKLVDMCCGLVNHSR
jgi:hypothetical protein